MQLFLHRAYFGHGIFGFEEASAALFGKFLAELDVGEAAVLVAPIRSPVRHNPWCEPKRVRKRRDWVLSRMLECGFVTDAEYEEATGRELELCPPLSEIR